MELGDPLCRQGEHLDRLNVSAILNIYADELHVELADDPGPDFVARRLTNSRQGTNHPIDRRDRQAVSQFRMYQLPLLGQWCPDLPS
jgi:hypothetical protein